jgi:hypothetical protein
MSRRRLSAHVLVRVVAHAAAAMHQRRRPWRSRLAAPRRAPVRHCDKLPPRWRRGMTARVACAPMRGEAARPQHAALVLVVAACLCGSRRGCLPRITGSSTGGFSTTHPNFAGITLLLSCTCLCVLWGAVMAVQCVRALPPCGPEPFALQLPGWSQAMRAQAQRCARAAHAICRPRCSAYCAMVEVLRVGAVTLSAVAYDHATVGAGRRRVVTAPL